MYSKNNYKKCFNINYLFMYTNLSRTVFPVCGTLTPINNSTRSKEQLYSNEFNILNRTEHDIYFNLSIYIQLIVANKTYIYIACTNDII